MDSDERAVWLRDLDGTGSMHPAAKGDPGAVMYVPASALRSSGEAVGYLITWNDGTKQVSVDPCHADDGNCVPLYLHPATVTDEDVERACIVMSRIGEDTEWPADYDDADQAAIRHFMRAALESFVRKQPAASAALERV